MREGGKERSAFWGEGDEGDGCFGESEERWGGDEQQRLERRGTLGGLRGGAEREAKGEGRTRQIRFERDEIKEEI